MVAGDVVDTPTGHGRIIVSGAMDAWRYRDAGAGAFDRFWQSLVAEAAAGSGAVRLEFARDLASPGSRVPFLVRYRSMTPPATVEAGAVARCGAGPARAIRLQPAGSAGVFRGELAIGDAAACEIEVVVNDAHTSGSMAVMRDARPAVPQTLAKLERLARRTGGVVTDDDTLAPIVDQLAAMPAPAPMMAPVHPMRSAWWLLPFAGGLSIEWWLRRRRGLR
jgi:hypothetical protein